MDGVRTLVRRTVPLGLRRQLRSLRPPHHGRHWVRVVMDREIEEHLRRLDPARCDALEVSGEGRSRLPWKSFTSVHYPDFDLLAPHDIGRFDVVICEQVLEHVADPWRATQTLAALCRPGGSVIVSTPFMLRVHPNPVDYWRFTASGLTELLQFAGLDVATVGSWGNMWCIPRNHRRWAVFRPWHRVLARWALRNDPLAPQVVWAFARRPEASRPSRDHAGHRQ